MQGSDRDGRCQQLYAVLGDCVLKSTGWS